MRLMKMMKMMMTLLCLCVVTMTTVSMIRTWPVLVYLTHSHQLIVSKVIHSCFNIDNCQLFTVRV